jgi:hypothetical protein
MCLSQNFELNVSGNRENPMFHGWVGLKLERAEAELRQRYSYLSSAFGLVLFGHKQHICKNGLSMWF